MKQQKILWLLSFACLIACTNKGIDFTYSPAEPKAGETVIFANHTEKGDSWLWTFSDDTYSTLRSPSKIFKKPGTYTVTLTVDSVRWKTVSKEITIYDTVPSLSLSSDSILYMQEVTLQALVYNPFKKDLSYQWKLPETAVITSGKTNDETLTVYFNKPMTTETICLEVTLAGETTVALKEVNIYDNKAVGIILQTDNAGLYRQRLFNIGMSDALPLERWDGQFLQDTYLYNDLRIARRDGKIVGEELSDDGTVKSSRDIYVGSVSEFCLDAVGQKLYAIENGSLLVMNIDGSQVSRWNTIQCLHICLALERGSLFLASAEGVYEMSLVYNPQNSVTAQPTLRSQLKGVKAIAYDKEER